MLRLSAPLSRLPALLHMCVMAVLGHMVLAGVRFTTSLYALSLNASTFTVGTLAAVFALLPMVFAVHAGRWQDRVGLVLPLKLGALSMLLGAGLVLWKQHLWALYLTAALVGAGFMQMHIASQTLVGVLSRSDNRAANYSWLATGFSISGFCGPVIAGFVIDHFGHQRAYLIFAVLALLVLYFSGRSRYLPEGHTPSSSKAKVASDINSEISTSNPSSPNKGNVLDLFWHDKHLRHIYFIGILLASSWDLFSFVIPIHGTRQGLSAATIGLVMGCFAAATFTVRLAMPYLARRWNEWQILVAALSITCLGFLLLPWLNTAWSMMLLAFALGLGLGASQPNMLNLLHQAAPPERAAEAIGVRVTIGNASQVFLPLGFGAIGASWGLLPVFLAMSTLLVFSLPSVWAAAKKPRK